MRRFRFEPPTDSYDERIATIDEKICELLKKRKDISNNHPGFPTKQHIAAWAEKYDFYEDFLNSVFADFLNEDIYKPVVEPTGFIKNIPVLKSFEKGELFFSVTYIGQFANASVVHFTIDRNDFAEQVEMYRREHSFYELSIAGGEGDYECRNEGGGGSGAHSAFTYVISPALPEDLSQNRFVFKECKMPFQKPTGFEFVI